MMTCVLDPAAAIAVEKGKRFEGGGDASAVYARYALAEDGVSSLAFPGMPGISVKANSYEHDERGIATEDAEVAEAQQDKRFAKGDSLEKEFAAHETIKVYGDESATDAIVFWGSGKTVILEAAKYFKKPVRLIQILWMAPFDADRAMEVLKGATNIIDIEYNHDGQLAGLLREQIGILPKQAILRYDTKPFTPLELAEIINEAL
jgi:2-oxoglutarate ferredoxin oxidoreductase subunit alpha